MRVLIIANARSGKGRGVRAAMGASRWLASPEGGGHSVRVVDGGPGSSAPEIEAGAGESDVLVIAGGDGSVHHAVPIAMRAGVPLYHLPCGNENLLAREFGMTRSGRMLSDAIDRGKRVAVDVGTIRDEGRAAGNDAARHFLLMVSFGPDASVVHRLAASRTKATGHLAYAGPIAAEFLKPHLPRMSVWVDGAKVVDERRGILVVANCRQYAFRIDPCHGASMSDGKLDFVFLPCEGRWGALVWAWRCRRRVAEKRGAVAGVGNEIRVRAPDGASQVDGEVHARHRGEVVCGIEAGTVPCLVPSSGA